MSILSLITEILFVGHSLVGPNLPPLVEGGLRASGANVSVSAQVINGAPLRYNWDNSTEAEGPDARAVLPLGKTDVLILTEAIPLAGQVEWNDSAGRVAAFADLAWSANPATQVFVYETWHDLDSGPGATVADDPGAGVLWRDRIAADLPVWEGLTNPANSMRPDGAPLVRVIPAGQAMALAADAIAAGQVPGAKSIRDLFSDDIHPNGKGFYLVAMVHIAAITGKSPEGLPAKLTRAWQTRDSVISTEQALAFQRIAWTAVQVQRTREAALPVAPPSVLETALQPEPEPTTVAQAQAFPDPTAPPTTFARVTNPSLGLGLAGVNDWSVQQPFLDVMKTARPWIGHLPGQWGGWDHTALAKGGWLDANGWPKGVPPEITGISTLFLSELPEAAAGVAGRYVLTYQGKGDLKLEGRAQNQQSFPGGITFDFTPGEGFVMLTITATDAADPLRNITVVREDRQAAFATGAVFNPDWLARIRGVRMVRFMDWMATNDSPLALVADRPKPDDYTWARLGVPVEVMVALANELLADPWFTIPHLADDDLVRVYAQVARDGLAPTLRAHIEYSNEVWNWQFTQARWAEEQGKLRWGQDQAWVQFYALRASQVADIWAQIYGDQAKARLVRVIATQTGVLGIEDTILNAPLVVGDGLAAPVTHFDAYAVTGYFAALLGSDEKHNLVRGWLADSLAAANADADAQGLAGAVRDAYVASHRFDRATALAAQELQDGALSGWPADTLHELLTQVLPYQADVAKKYGLQLMMYEGGSHVVGYGAQVEDVEQVAFFQHLNFSPEMGALYQQLLVGWKRLSNAPFNAFVDVYAPTKWGSWGALRHLGDDNPRWQALALGCGKC